MLIKTDRLTIKKFTLDMAYDVHINSLDEDVKAFIPDEYFETEEDAYETLEFLISKYNSETGPYVYPIFLKGNINIGYIQLVKIKEGFEVGYHISKKYTKKGYATEALIAFMNYAFENFKLTEIYGITLENNTASRRVLEKSGFILLFLGKDKYHGKLNQICKYIKKKINV